MLNMTMPNFLVIGAMKAGTTALYSYLRQHPDVFMPEDKEPHYFAFAGQDPQFRGPGADKTLNSAVTQRADYEALFRRASGRHAVGEASPTTMYSPGAAERIRREVPDMRLIAILRQPADRAYSAFLHLKRDGLEPACDFAEAIELEASRIRDNWGMWWRYRSAGLYGEQLSRFYALFPTSAIRVYFQEDLLRDPLAVLRDAYEFIGVDPSFIPDVSFRPNLAGIPRNRLVGALFGWRFPLRHRVAATVPRDVRWRILRWIAERGLSRPPLDGRVREELTAGFAPDIERLSALTGHQLGRWLDRHPA